jgi:hypothetical protein
MSRLDDAFAQIDTANAADPETEEVDGEQVPKAVLYGRRMSARLEAFRPDASEALKVACRAQHIRRFEVPRDSYPMDRAGYHRWRTDLGKRHAQHAAEIMAAVGYDEDTIERTESLLRKKNLAKDPEAQTLEDVACLVFLEHYYAPFIADKDDDKVVVILQKTWKKMSDGGRAAAKEIAVEGRAKTLLAKALAA